MKKIPHTLLKRTINPFIILYLGYCDELELVKGRNRDLKFSLFWGNIHNKKKFFDFVFK